MAIHRWMTCHSFSKWWKIRVTGHGHLFHGEILGLHSCLSVDRNPSTDDVTFLQQMVLNRGNRSWTYVSWAILGLHSCPFPNCSSAHAALGRIHGVSAGT